MGEKKKKQALSLPGPPNFEYFCFFFFCSCTPIFFFSFFVFILPLAFLSTYFSFFDVKFIKLKKNSILIYPWFSSLPSALLCLYCQFLLSVLFSQFQENCCQRFPTLPLQVKNADTYDTCSRRFYYVGVQYYLLWCPARFASWSCSFYRIYQYPSIHCEHSH